VRPLPAERRALPSAGTALITPCPLTPSAAYLIYRDLTRDDDPWNYGNVVVRPIPEIHVGLDEPDDDQIAGSVARLQREQAAHRDRCKIYVLDPSTELAPQLDVPLCDINKVWPSPPPSIDTDDEGDPPLSGAASTNSTPHWAAQHAAGYWAASSFRSSRYLTSNISEAEVIYVDMHCYLSWYLAEVEESRKRGRARLFNDQSGE
jgi:hypothetical protein